MDAAAPLPYDVIDALRAAGCVFAEEEADLLVAAATDLAGLDSLVVQRVSGVPLEHVLGWAEFCGLRVRLDPGVFVPRRRSELVVAEAVRRVRSGYVLLDLCCGSGAIGLAVAHAARELEVHAVDIDPVAVDCAARNLAGVGGCALLGDLYDTLPGRLAGRVDVIVANAPYVPSGRIATMPPEAREHEPRAALDGGPDGLRVQARVVEQAPRWLRPGGHLLVETSQSQAAGTLRLMRAAGLAAEPVTDPDLDATVVIGTRSEG